MNAFVHDSVAQGSRRHTHTHNCFGDDEAAMICEPGGAHDNKGQGEHQSGKEEMVQREVSLI